MNAEYLDEIALDAIYEDVRGFLHRDGARFASELASQCRKFTQAPCA